ncbi:MAG: hypothetical protein ACREF7_01045, partial [Candidatus Saccharimonadales bacterium]
LARYFQPVFEAEDLLRIPNFNTIVRTLINGVPTQPFSMATLPSLGEPSPELAETLKQLSAAKYGRPRSVVEREIFARMETKPVAPPPNSLATSSPPASPSNRVPAMQANNPPSRPTPGTGSFLDEWMAKKQTIPATPSNVAVPMPAQPQIAPPLATPISVPVPAQVNTQPNAHDGDSENISSELLDSQEANKIAHELEVDLKKTKPVETKPVSPTAPTKQPDLTEFPRDDTIYIDRDGNLKSVNSSK